jgi:hypothetical protein
VTAVLIEPADLNRLAAEIQRDGDACAWFEQHKISEDALNAMLAAGTRSFVARIERGQDPFHALADLLSATFMLVWEAHKEYAGGGA